MDWESEELPWKVQRYIEELEQQLAALRDALVQIQKTYDLSEAWNVASAALQEGSDSE